MLFTNTFLRKQVVPDSTVARDLIKAFSQVYVLWAKATAQGAEWDEGQTEKSFVQPLLEILGWSFAVQVKMRDVGDVTQPDYTLFEDTLSRVLGESMGTGSAEYYHKALAIAEAKHWYRPLDLRDEGQRDTWKANANPDHQMLGYLKKSNVSWGVLTNGSTWRLYHHAPSSAATDYYEIDLSEIYRGVDPKISPGVERLERFYIWWRLFQCSTFIPDGSGLPYIQHLLEDFYHYREGIRERLVNRILEQAVPAIIEGILLQRYRKYGNSPDAAIDIEELTSAASNLVFRMLFLFAAEYKGLLPVDSQGNQVMGICSLANAVVNKRENALNSYAELLKLYKTVYQGDRQQHIPSYRSELYNPHNPDFAFLENHPLTDALVYSVFEALTVDGKEAVDFDCMDSDMLAEMAASLLNLSISFVEMPFNRREIKAKIDSPLTVQTGDTESIRLNKAPIEYLIHQTLKTVMEERSQQFRSAMDDIVKLRTATNLNFPSQSVDTRQQLKSANEKVVNAMLGIKILDPQMRTGRCLLDVIQYLTREIIVRMQVYHDLHPNIPWDWNPIYVLLEQDRKRSLARMSRYGLVVPLSEFGDTKLLKRMITHRCIYGVDANPITAEIAKHNIWLESFSVGSPFTYLDLHLRHGDAVIGTLVRDDFGSRKELIQTKLAEGFATAMDRISDFEKTLDTGRLDLKQSETLQHTVAPFQTWMDLSVLDNLGDTEASALLQNSNDNLDVSRNISATKQLTNNQIYFHWDLAFPDVFVKEMSGVPNEQAGFDAVISLIDAQIRIPDNRYTDAFVKTKFDTVQPTQNPNWLFFAQGLRLLNDKGTIGMVINRKAYIARKGPLDEVIKRLQVRENQP